MNTGEMFESFDDATETLSNQVRYVNYSLIAVLWIISHQTVSELLMKENAIVLLLVVLSLLLDLLQYVWKSFTIWKYARGIEKKEHESGIESGDHLFPLYISNGTWVLFIAKIIACLAACVIIAVQLLS